LVELMGGEMNVESKKNEGTTVTVELRLTKGNKSQLVKKESYQVDTRQLIGRKVLVVDDNEMNRLVASVILENYSSEVIEAENGKQAVELTREMKPEIILMDVQMPIMNGFEATRELRESGNNIPIIALTANAIKGENQKCFDAGMNDYISKPYKENELLYKLVKWLDGKEITEETASVEDNTTEEKSSRKRELYDLGGLKDIGGGNKAFMEKMIKMFCDLTPPMVDEMLTAYQNGDYTKMGAIAHKMKPSIDNLRISTITQDIRTIEMAGKNNSVDENTEGLLEKVKNTIQKVIEELQNDDLS